MISGDHARKTGSKAAALFASNHGDDDGTLIDASLVAMREAYAAYQLEDGRVVPRFLRVSLRGISATSVPVGPVLYNCPPRILALVERHVAGDPAFADWHRRCRERIAKRRALRLSTGDLVRLDDGRLFLFDQRRGLVPCDTLGREIGRPEAIRRWRDHVVERLADEAVKAMRMEAQRRSDIGRFLERVHERRGDHPLLSRLHHLDDGRAVRLDFDPAGGQECPWRVRVADAEVGRWPTHTDAERAFLAAIPQPEQTLFPGF